MSRFLISLLVFTNLVFADNFYEKALEFEKNGEYKEAMRYYKLAAEQNLDTKNSTKFKPVAQPNLEPNSSSNLVKNGKMIVSQNSAKEPKEEIKLEKNYYEIDDKNYFGLNPYEPIYMAWVYDFSKKPDRDKRETKFQISFEKPLFKDLLGFDETLSFAYTQVSWWQVYEDSSPFRTTNYRPELFVSVPTEFYNMEYLRLGVLHESNGKGGTDSRSWNKVYLQTNFKFGNFELTPRIWHAFFMDEENKNIDDYMGFADLRAKYKYGNHHFSAIFRNNMRFSGDNRGALGLDWSFPLFNTGIYGYVQYFTGYGESLADFDRSVDKVSLGVALYR